MSTPIHELERSYGDFPREHQFSTLENLDREPEMEVLFGAAEKLVAQWTGDRFAGLYLYGEPGTGKTHAAIGVARALQETGASIHYRHVPSWRPANRVESHGFMDQHVTEVQPHITDWVGKIYEHDTDLPKPFPTARPKKDGAYSTRYEQVHDKSVLILDDYKPFARNYVASAIEAASEYGGLVIVTSNYTDPFKIVEETPDEKQLNAKIDAFTGIEPSIAGLGDVARSEQAAKRDALRSRVAAGFKFIRFEGEDRRIQSSFWND